MKKYLLILVIVLTVIMCGCQANGDTKTIDQQSNNEMNATEIASKSECGENISIIIHSLDQIDDIKAIINEEGESKAFDTLIEFPGAGLKSKEDLIRFLEVVNTLPTLDLIDGEMSTISYEKGHAQDTGKEYEFAYIAIKANDGSWVRFEYLLSKENSATIDTNISSAEQGITVFSKPIQNTDGRVKIFSEQSEDHPSGEGKLFTWDAKIAEMNARIVYYTEKHDKIDTVTTFSSVNILKINEEKS